MLGVAWWSLAVPLGALWRSGVVGGVFNEWMAGVGGYCWWRIVVVGWLCRVVPGCQWRPLDPSARAWWCNGKLSVGVVFRMLYVVVNVLPHQCPGPMVCGLC